MDDMIRRCVDAKRDVFVQYFDVPPEVRPDMDSLMARIEALGEVSRNAQDFEARFAAELQPEYNAMFQRCRPRAVTMTKEQKTDFIKLLMSEPDRKRCYRADCGPCDDRP